ncbi:MAG: helix-turn-helix domain-containing protein [Deltaproteobacteria bacterium]|nr:helix-turn-helix domain-containing protein [Deltaproteobacteria bacterium]
MRARRGASIGEEAALVLEVTKGTYYKIERGTHAPSLATALKLAKWLGWTVEQVVEAAGQPASAAADGHPPEHNGLQGERS